MLAEEDVFFRRGEADVGICAAHQAELEPVSLCWATSDSPEWLICMNDLFRHSSATSDYSTKKCNTEAS
jgi:hypothetical protein